MTIPNFPNTISIPNEYAASGSNYAFTFPYIGQEDYNGTTSPYLTVYYDSVEGERTFPTFTQDTSTSIVLTTPLSTGTVVIWRNSSALGKLVDFQTVNPSGNILEMQNLQNFYLFEELVALQENTFTTQNETQNLNIEFDFVGDGTTTVFPLTDGVTTITVLPTEMALWIHQNAAFVQSGDFTVALNGGTGIVELTLEVAPALNDNINVRLATFAALAASLAAGQVTCLELADNAICSLSKFDLDGTGSANQFLGYDGTATFLPISLLSSMISDFDASVIAHTLDEFAVPVANVDLNNKKIVNQADPTSDQDGATKKYVDDSIASDGGLDVSATVVGTVMTLNTPRDNAGTKSMFVNAFVHLDVSGNNMEVTFQIKPIGSGSWVSVGQVFREVNVNDRKRENISFFCPADYQYRYISSYSHSVTVTEQAF